MPSQPPAASSEPRSGDRIAKLLARAGIASRREVERMIAEGRVALHGVVIDTPATLLTSLDGVTVDGQPVAAVAAARLFVYHKPVGLLVTERDPAGRPTIYDRLPPELPRVVPVGRLDLATEGLLLLTTDGGLKRQLELPATGVERTYRARAYGSVSQAQLEELIHGVEIEGMRYGPIDANLERRTGANGWIELTLTEGKNREVRRVLEYLGLEVSRLIRTRYGPFVLGDMAAGDVGEIRQHDLEEFRKTLKSGGGKVANAVPSMMAEPLPRPAPTTLPAADRVRTPARPGRREASERRPATAAPSRAADPANRERAAATASPRDNRPFPGASSRSSRVADTRDERPPRPDPRTGRAAPPASQRNERRPAFGDRARPLATRTAVRAQAGRAPADEKERARRGPARGDAAAERPREGRDPPRSGRTGRSPSTDTASPRPAQRPTPSRSAPDRSPSGDRSRGPAGGRGKPQDPRRPKTPPRGKR